MEFAHAKARQQQQQSMNVYFIDANSNTQKSEYRMCLCDDGLKQ
jgi:hypothetical protein